MRYVIGVLLALAIQAATYSAITPAAAQTVLAFVNGEPITSVDVEHRIRIMQVLARTGLTQKQALEQLIDDRLKIIEARRIGYRLKDDNIEDRMSSIAMQNNQTLPEFIANLSRAGVDTQAFKLKLRADYSWELALSQKGKAAAAVGADSEVREVYQKKLNEGAAKVTDYVIVTVIFVVPRTGEGVGQREREAQAARGAFSSCETGIDDLRKLRDVAIRAPVKRSSNQIPPQLNKIFADTPVGRMSPPMRTTQGIELYAVCEKIERIDQSAVRTTAEQEVASKRNATLAEGYLKNLRKTAVIQYR